MPKLTKDEAVLVVFYADSYRVKNNSKLPLSVCMWHLISKHNCVISNSELKDKLKNVLTGFKNDFSLDFYGNICNEKTLQLFYKNMVD